jgi:predicted TIM-barrel fold metal-dependent hydrolase
VSRDGFEVIDVHHHVGGVPSLMGDVAAHDSMETRAEPAELTDDLESSVRLEIMDANGVDAAVVMPTHEYLRPNGHVDTMALNDAIAAYRDRQPDRFVAAVGIVEPLHGGRSHDELRRARDALGLVGVSFHSRFQGVGMDSPLMTSLVRAAVELGLVPFVHAYADSIDEAPWKIVDVARELADAPIVVLDGFSGFERTKDITRAAREAPNLVFDTSLVYSFDFVEHFIDAFGPDRVLFGTDMYSAPLAYRHSYTLDQVLDSRLDAPTKQAVLSGNVRRLLGLG